jgi:hypothetical protein
MSREELEKYEMINQGSVKVNGMNEMQQQFFTKYVKEKGWDITNLTDQQIKEIKSQKGYNGMILG